MALIDFTPLFKGMTRIQHELKLINRSLERLADMAQDHLEAQKIVPPLQEPVEEGEVYWDDRTEKEEFKEQLETKEVEDEEERLKHADFLKQLEAESRRLAKHTAFVPGVGPEGAEDPAEASEVSGGDGDGPPPRIEGFGSGEVTEE